MFFVYEVAVLSVTVHICDSACGGGRTRKKRDRVMGYNRIRLEIEQNVFRDFRMPTKESIIIGQSRGHRNNKNRTRARALVTLRIRRESRRAK